LTLNYQSLTEIFFILKKQIIISTALKEYKSTSRLS